MASPAFGHLAATGIAGAQKQDLQSFSFRLDAERKMNGDEGMLTL